MSGAGKGILIGTAVLAVILLGLVGALLSKALDDPPYDNIPKETISSTRTADMRPRSIWSFHTALDSTVFVVSRLLTDFDDKWRKAAPENVFPILGRFDAVCRLEEQGPSYGGTPVEIWERGHLTTVLAVRALRQFFLKQLPP